MPSKHTKSTEPKSFNDLITDPHFLFTIFSLGASVCVFFYYLFQLLFRTKDWRTGESYTPNSSKRIDRTGSGNKLLSSSQIAGTPSKKTTAEQAAFAAKKKKDDDLTDDGGDGSTEDQQAQAPTITSPSRLSQAELASEIEKKINALKLRGDLRKHLLQIIEHGEEGEEKKGTNDGVPSEAAATTREEPRQPPAAVASETKPQPATELRRRKAAKE